MGQSQSNHPPKTLNLIDFRKNTQAGDLILISTTESVETDVKIPPVLLHNIKYNLENRISVSNTKHFPVWDTAGIVVDMNLSPNSGKFILELTPNGFVQSEFLGRMAELKRKKFHISVRFISGARTVEFRERLKIIADHLSGKTLDELAGTEAYREIRRKVDDIVDDTSRPSQMFAELKKAFYMTCTNPDDMTLNKSQLHDLLREFTGLRMDVDSEKLAEQMHIPDSMTFEEFKELWAAGPGRKVLAEEFYEPSLLVGQFLRYIYSSCNVIYEDDVEDLMPLTPEDFGTSKEFGRAMKNPSLKTYPEFVFEPQLPVLL